MPETRPLDGGLHLRPAGPEDTDALVGLLRAVFPDNPKADRDVLRWQFWDDPYGRAASWVVADEAGRLVCHFAVLPIPALLDGRRITAAKPADAATLPSHRGQGLMGIAAAAVFEECRERDIPVTVCLPNFRARGALLKIGMTPVAPVRAYVAALDAGWLASRFGVPRPAARALRAAAFRVPDRGRGRAVARVPDGLDELWAVTAEATPTGTVHDAGWWRWRYEERPHAPYRYHEVRSTEGRLEAACASVVRDAYGGAFLHLLDVQARGTDSAREVVGAAVADAEAVGVAAIGLPGTRATELLRAAGLRPLPRRLEPNEQVLGLFHNDPTAGDLTDRRWSISWTDLDHL